MREETPVANFIALVISDELPTDQVKIWYRLATGLLPSGLATSVQVEGENGGRVSVSMLCKASEDLYRYTIPLSRNLTEEEAEPIVRAVGDRYEGDFDIVVSKCAAEAALPEQEIEIGHERYDAICRAFAKRQHENWVKDRTDAGWRYDTRMSIADRTNPMLKPWDELPETLRTVDYKQPQALVDLLSDQGYAVISKEELAGILKLLRSTP